MLEAITSSISVVLGWIGTVVESLLTAEGDLYALMPLLAIGITVSAIFLAVKVIRGLIWGA